MFNVVDSGRLTKKDYMDMLVRKLYPEARVVYIPYRALHEIVRLQERLTAVMGRKPFLTRYRLKSSQNRIVYDSSKIDRTYGWKLSTHPR